MAGHAVQVSKKENEVPFSEGGIDISEFGKENTFRYNILMLVMNEKYDEAVEALKRFQEGPSDYPNFKSRVTRYVQYSIELVYAIKAKRSFPGLKSLTRAKQQELREKFRSHIRELVQALRIIENIQIDLRVRDASSTKYVIKAIWAAFLCIAFLGFLLEFSDWLGKASYIVVDDLFANVADWVINKLGL